MRKIPISAARRIAEHYGYDQVVIYARKVGEDPEPHGEHMTTYGRDAVHCGVAARIGEKLREIMGWDKARVTQDLPGAAHHLPDDPRLDEKFSSLVLSTGPYTILKRNIPEATIRDIGEMTNRDLLNFPGMGRTKVEEIRASIRSFLSQRGIKA